MGEWRSIGLLTLIACAAAVGQVQAQMSSECVGAPHLRQTCEAEFIAECVKHWDAGTNMSKEDYVQACRRIARERVEFLIKQKKN